MPNIRSNSSDLAFYGELCYTPLGAECAKANGQAKPIDYRRDHKWQS